MDQINKIKLFILWGFRAVLVIAMIVALCLHDWKNFFFLIFISIVTFLPDMLERKLRIDYPGELDILVLFFITASMFLGELHDFYTKYAWWDVMLHSLSGIAIGGIGFSLIFILNRHEKVALKLSPAFVAVFAFCFAMAVGGLWEIFEFAMDQAFDFNMQRSGLVDTMWDLILDAIGAFLFSLVGYLHIVGNISVFNRMEKKFFKCNPEFKEKK